MAQLERSEENRLRASRRLAKGEDDKIAVGKRPNNYTGKTTKKEELRASGAPRTHTIGFRIATETMVN